jgi:hypothetical protein
MKKTESGKTMSDVLDELNASVARSSGQPVRKSQAKAQPTQAGISPSAASAVLSAKTGVPGKKLPSATDQLVPALPEARQLTPEQIKLLLSLKTGKPK